MPIILLPSAGGIDVITVAEAKKALNIDLANDDHDTELASYVSGVSLAMDKIFGPIVQRSVVEAHSGGKGCIALRRYPVASISTVVERAGASAATLVAEDFEATTAYDYSFDADSGLLTRR